MTSKNHEMLDLVLIPKHHAHRIHNLQIIKDFAIPSHHYLVIAHLHSSLEHQHSHSQIQQYDLHALKDQCMRDSFIKGVEDNMISAIEMGNLQDIESFQLAWEQSFSAAASEILPNRVIARKKPWTSERTLRYIEERNDANRCSDFSKKESMNKLIKKSVKQDKESWFYEILKEKNWAAVQKIRKQRSSTCSNLVIDGKTICNHERAE